MDAEVVQIRLYDLGAEVDLSGIQTLLALPTHPAPVVAQSAAPPSSRFAQPIEVILSPAGAPAGARVEVRLHSAGVVAVRLRWMTAAVDLVAMARGAAAAQAEGQPAADYSRALATRVQQELGAALQRPSGGPLQEEQYTAYCVHLPPDQVAGFLARQSVAIAQLTSDSPGQDMVPARLAAANKHTLQYTPGDAVVLGWDHAVILDEPGQYEDILDVMELANLELLEFRTYDQLLDRRLEASFRSLDRLWGPAGLFRSARSALRDISRLRVEFARLTDNLHDTGKVFGDWYVAQLHQRLHDRFHLASWERAVDAKMDTLEDMFHLAQEEANHRRSLVLEVMIVLLFVLDLLLLFRVGA